MPYRLSVLDQSPIPDGHTAAEALANTLDLATRCDALGYDRYWLAEHHASPGLAGVAPEALIGPVALATKRIRVGSGGIMLPHYSPFKVAETFRMLSALAPGRIDLGLGRPTDHPFASLRDTLPRGHGGSPDLWLLGSSPDSAAWAGETGLPYCIADFINSDAVPLADIYRSTFRPSRWLDKPHLMVATWVIAADTPKEAKRQALPAQVMFAHLVRGELIAVPSVEKAEEWARNRPLPERGRRVTLGTGAEVREALDDVAGLYGADEMMLVNIMHDHAARCRSYQLVAEAFALDGARLVESGGFTQN
jgi:alkanesulfonate monooxygenase SsuD/methylene tetrahydromethanopterin reductase-like flavin-dependent oxidoreductase (luciferase family)